MNYNQFCRAFRLIIQCLLFMTNFTYAADSFINTSEAKIVVSSPISLMDEFLSIEIQGLQPFQKAKIEAVMTDDNGERWSSWALFQSDANGSIVLSSDSPISGSYEQADGMGIFWSMKPVLNRFASFKKKGDFEVDLSLIVDERVVQRRSIQRLRKFADVRQIDVSEEGLVASLFIPSSERPLPVIIILSGSNGGLGENRAKLLASHGFSVLALGYFGVEGLPPNLENISLEYFEKAFAWLSRRNDVKGNCIGLYGASRGAELALILASVFPDKIQAVVATVPSHVTFAGLGNKHIPAWLYNGKPVGPDAPVPMTDTSNGRGHSPEHPIAATVDFLKGLNEYPDEFLAAEIPVEKIEGALMLISGGDDQMWPSSLFSQKIMQRLDEKNSSIIRTHLEYPLAGHQVNIPFLPSSESIYYHPHGKLWFSMGGSPQQDDLASRDSWNKLIEFFKTNLFSKF